MKLVSEEERENILASFSSILGDLRRALNLTQTQFGEMAGISRQQLSALERGVCPLTWARFNSLLLVFLSNEKTREILMNKKILTDELMDLLGG